VAEPGAEVVHGAFNASGAPRDVQE
jgi:hypothetical protein